MKKKVLYSILSFILFSSQLLFSQWESRTNGLPSHWAIGLAIDASDSNTAVISLRFDGLEGIYLTTDAGNNWKEITPFTENFDEGTDISIIDKNNIWVTTGGLDSGRILYSSDEGQNWIVQFKDTSKTTYFNYIEMFDSQNGIAMGDAVNDSKIPLFLKTNNGGQTWISMNDKAIGGYSGDSWRRLDFVTTEIGYFNVSGVDSEKRINKTSNGCEDWTLLDYPNGVHNIKFFDEQIGLVKHFEYNSEEPNNPFHIIGRTVDGGNTWESFEMDDLGWGNDFEFIPGDPSQVWFVDGWGHGLYYSNDTGSTWRKTDYPLNIELAGRDIVFVDDKHGWILGDSGNLLYTNNNGGMITNIENDKPNVLPIGFNLEQNYPNPFNPTTKIKYSIPNIERLTKSFSNVILKVFNILGKEIVTLVNEVKPSGNYSVEFNAENLPSGIYYYQLKTDNLVQTKKMILLK
ncbi:MAG: T9SS type A sorting domain-containing protein [Ignavibacteriae bacterium]|nr:T9SS type A sorting domain-containing protein [Ignavibacteriota bacterium]